jgi:hypothetical protein
VSTKPWSRTVLPENFFLSVAGTPESGGWTTREVKRIIRGLTGLNFVYVNHFLKLCSKSHVALTNVYFHHPVAQTSSKSRPHTITLTSQALPQLTSYTTFFRSSYRPNRRSREVAVSRGKLPEEPPHCTEKTNKILKCVYVRCFISITTATQYNMREVQHHVGCGNLATRR